MKFRNNTIFQFDDDSHNKIKYIIKKYKRVLFVDENKRKTENLEDLEDFRSANLHYNTVKSRMIITKHSFFYLVRKGFLKCEYDAVIFCLRELTPAEVSTFRIFYFHDIKNNQHCRIFAFLDQINESDPIYLHSQVHKDDTLVSESKPLKLIICKPIFNSQQPTYIQLKKILNYDDPEKLEDVCYKEAFKRILVEMKKNKQLTIKAANYKQVSVSKVELYHIGLVDCKIKILISIIKQYKDKRVYVVCKREILLNYLNFFNEHENDLDLIIYYDLLECPKSAKKVFILVDKHSDFDHIARIHRKYDNNSFHGFFNHLHTKQETLTTAKGACIEKNFAHVFLDRILVNIQHIFSNHLLFISNLAYVKGFLKKDSAYQCYIQLPKISDHILFNRIHFSPEQRSKKDALQTAALDVLKSLKMHNCIDDNFVPIVEFFILNDRFKSLLHSMYRFKLDWFNNFNIEYKRNIVRIRQSPFQYYYEHIVDNLARAPGIARGVYRRARVCRKGRLPATDKKRRVAHVSDDSNNNCNGMNNNDCDSMNNFKNNSNSINNSINDSTSSHQDATHFTTPQCSVQHNEQSVTLTGNQIHKQVNKQSYHSLLNTLKKMPKYLNCVFNCLFLTFYKFSQTHSPYILKSAFKQKHMLTLRKPDRPKTITTVNIPKCFQPNAYDHLYRLLIDDFEIGLLCGPSFRHFTTKNVRIEFIRHLSLSPLELNHILLYNTVFFGITARKTGIYSNYHYLVVPLHKDKPVKTSFHGSLFDNQHCTNNLLFNPINRTFYVFDRWIEQSIQDVYKFGDTVDESVNDMIESESISDTVYSVESIDSVDMIDSNNDTGNHTIDSKTNLINTKNSITYAEHFQQKYTVTLKHTNKHLKNLILTGTIYTAKGKRQCPAVLSSELLKVTPFPVELHTHHQKFKFILVFFEILSLANEARHTLQLPLTLNSVYRCLTPRNDTFLNYDKLEFLGDTLLKYITTMYLLINYNYDISTLITIKCKIVENANLSKKGYTLHRFVSQQAFHAPFSDFPLFTRFKSFFNISKEFYSAYSNSSFNSKTTADILEALIGACYIENGLHRTECLLFELGILNCDEKCTCESECKCDSNKENDNNKESNKDCIVESNKECNKENEYYNNNIEYSNPIMLKSDSETIDINLNDELERVLNTVQSVQVYDESVFDQYSVSIDYNDCNNDSIDNDNDNDSIDCTDCIDSINNTINTINNTINNNKVPFLSHFNSLFSNNQYITSISRYYGILSPQSIKSVERILNYTFKNKGLLEKAMIHPSSSNNIFGNRVYFEKLELIGDSLLDVCVTKELFTEHECDDCREEEYMSERKEECINNDYDCSINDTVNDNDTIKNNNTVSNSNTVNDNTISNTTTVNNTINNNCAFQLHEKRKQLVNNQIFANVLYNSKLYHFIETCFKKDDIKDNYLINRYKKIWGDIFEAINGSILIDMGYDIEEYERVWVNIRKWLYECYEERKHMV